jgi:citrate lyase subunit beta/citryl-CoA lyase
MSASAPPRSWLYMPASRPELLPKALAGPADAVIVDLEDAVAPSLKDQARAELTGLATIPRNGKPLWVRINHPATEWGDRDIEVLADVEVDGVRIPKADDPAIVADVASRLHRPLHLILESALGVHRAYELATASPCVRGVALGEADLLADLRGLDESALGFARGQVVLAARAAGLDSPIQSAFTDLADAQGLHATSLAGRRAGFVGRTVVHPRQVKVVNRAYTPTTDEIDDARAVVTALGSSSNAAVVDERGRFLDPALVAQARVVLALAGRASIAPSVTKTSGR